MKLLNTITLCVSLISFAAAAQEEIETDRPDQTENSALVPKGRFQFETGLKHEQTASNEMELTAPEILSKYGLHENIELRLITEFAYNKTEETESYGLQELKIGTKIKINDEEGVIPAVSFIAQFQIPKVEAKGFKSQHIAPELRLVMRNKLSEKSDLGYNAGVKWDGISPQPQYFYTIAPNLKITDKLQAFAESFGNFSVDHRGEQWIDGGLSLRLNPDVQLDLALGWECTKKDGEYHHFFEAVGFSIRI